MRSCDSIYRNIVSKYLSRWGRGINRLTTRIIWVNFEIGVNKRIYTACFITLHTILSRNDHLENVDSIIQSFAHSVPLSSGVTPT